MKVKRCPEVASLFRKACRREPSERAAFLDDACGDDVGLRAHVEVLLAADLDPGNRLEQHHGHLFPSRRGGSLFFLPSWRSGVLWLTTLGLVYTLKGES
ncbi:MAG: hypothetical protein SYC29_13545 [Planctomycetota bacterium]|nr:hypothetical protein [Planctomycetota bacterium]